MTPLFFLNPLFAFCISSKYCIFFFFALLLLVFFVCSEIIGQFKKKHRSPYCIFCIMKEEGFFLSTIIFWQWAMAAIVNNTTSNNEKLIQVHNKWYQICFPTLIRLYMFLHRSILRNDVLKITLLLSWTLVR